MATNSRSMREKMIFLEKYYQYQDSLAAFTKAAWKFIDPAPLSWSWHHDAICEHIQAVFKGQIRRLAVAMPPRHTKSTIISVAAPAWGWTWNPSIKFLCASYGMALSVRDSQRCRGLVDCNWYQDYFGRSFSWLPDQNNKARYENNQSGYRIATSVAGAATGEGGDIIIVDDPHNIHDAESDTVRRETLTWWASTMTSRLNDQQTGGVVIIGQRVHDMDLIGYVTRQDGWEYLVLPAEYEASATKIFTGIGWTDPRKEQGEVLWAEKFPKAVLERLKTVMQLNYFSQYQQRPVTEKGTIFKRETMLSYEDEGKTYLLQMADGTQKRVLKFLCRTIVSTDFAVSVSQQADFTCFLVWTVCPDGEALLTEIIIGKWEGPQAEDQLAALLMRLSAVWCVIVEDVAYQKSIIQRLRRKGFPVRPFRPLHDKIARAQSIAVYFALGFFFFSEHVLGFADYKQQILGFPRTDNDDMVDATSIMGETYEKGEPMMTSIDMHEARQGMGIEEIRATDPALADFLQEGLYS